MLHLKTLQKATASDGGLGETFGPMLIGYIVMLFLYSLALAQTVVYLRRSAGDSTRIKSAVVALWIVDNAHAAIAIIGMYTYLVKFHGNEHEVGLTSWTIGAQIYMTGLSDMIVRSIYAHRIWRLGNTSRMLPALIVCLSALTLTVGLIYGVALAGGLSWADSRVINWCGYVGDACEIIADAIIAFIMTRLLLRLRSGLPEKSPVLQTILSYSINTGLLTCFLVTASLILFITAPHSSAGLAIYIVLSKLYINALLGTLNARQRSEIARTEDAVPVLTTHVALATTEDVASENTQDITGEHLRGWEVPTSI
ncbi:hypothetical protein OBBRIDRAFT_332431 [Obba rivulosa]|uniref:DUF6534 domain-containing protein n=1 Tax=Obba rivulosa TaxID=1052685 RepID=A0A8E2AMX0_9APHY|nr:hypothetical protein OBBRIDRAFT_332431 [Obba rivulosa]